MRTSPALHLSISDTAVQLLGNFLDRHEWKHLYSSLEITLDINSLIKTKVKDASEIMGVT